MNHLGFPLAVAISSTFVLQWMGFKVMKARKAAGVPYPYLYADRVDADKDRKMYVFNCAQRAHQNTLENYSTFLLLLGIASIQHPFYAGISGTIFLLGRIAYAIGYCTGDPAKRQRGSFGYLGLLGLIGLSISSAYSYF
jgi:glutathione S-transferase